MSVYVYLLASGAAVLFLYLRLVKASKRGLAGVPGPRRLPFFGNSLQLRGKQFHLVMRDWSLKYGPVFKFDLLGKEMLAVTGYDALREVLVTRGQDFGGRQIASQGEVKVLQEVYRGRGIIGADLGPYLRRVRKQIHTSLKMYGSGLAHFDENMKHVLEELFQTFESKNQAPFDCFDDLHDTLAAFICTLISGRRVTKNDPSAVLTKKIDLILRKPNRNLMTNIVRRFPWLRHFFKSGTEADVESQRQFAAFWNNFILPLKDTEEFKAGRGLMAELCQLQQHLESGKSSKGNDEDDLGVVEEGENGEDDSPNITDDDISMIMRNLVNAGVITTTTSLYVLLNIFLHYPDVQEKIVDEIDHKIGPNNRVTLANKADLPYTRAVVLELLRFSSIAPTTMPHSAMADTEVQGYAVDKGTIVLPCLYVHHFNEKEWDEPFKFKPERFLEEDGSLPPADHPIRKKLLAFGAGPRACLGEVLARNRLFMFTASIVQKFRFLPPEGEPLVSCDPCDWQAALLMDPLKYKLRAIPRSVKSD